MPNRVLIAEDDLISLTLLKQMLEWSGSFEITSARDGEEAWAALETGVPFDICIVDLMMPSLDGLGLIKRIRSHATLRDLPVILCTACNERATVDQAAALHVSDYIVKPYARERVVRQVERVCARRHPAFSFEAISVSAARLGIPQQQVTVFLGTVFGETKSLVGAFRANKEAIGDRALLLRVNGLKGAAINLGAHSLCGSLSELERVCSANDQAALESAIGDVELEITRLEAAATGAGQPLAAVLAS